VRPLWDEYESSEIRLIDAYVDDIQPIVRVVERHRLHQVEALVEAYKRAKIVPFAPALVRLDMACRLFIPPVIECSSRGKELIDGAHRLYVLRGLRKTGKAPIKTVMVGSSYGPEFAEPAGVPGTWQDMRLVARKLARKGRFEDYRPDLLRPVAPYFSGSRLIFPSFDACRFWLDSILKDQARV
jgi:hypothetical protein